MYHHEACVVPRLRVSGLAWAKMVVSTRHLSLTRKSHGLSDDKDHLAFRMCCRRQVRACAPWTVVEWLRVIPPPIPSLSQSCWDICSTSEEAKELGGPGLLDAAADFSEPRVYRRGTSCHWASPLRRAVVEIATHCRARRRSGMTDHRIIVGIATPVAEVFITMLAVAAEFQ